MEWFVYEQSVHISKDDLNIIRAASNSSITNNLSEFGNSNRLPMPSLNGRIIYYVTGMSYTRSSANRNNNNAETMATTASSSSSNTRHSTYAKVTRDIAIASIVIGGLGFLLACLLLCFPKIPILMRPGATTAAPPIPIGDNAPTSVPATVA